MGRHARINRYCFLVGNRTRATSVHDLREFHFCEESILIPFSIYDQNLDNFRKVVHISRTIYCDVKRYIGRCCGRDQNDLAILTVEMLEAIFNAYHI